MGAKQQAGFGPLAITLTLAGEAAITVSAFCSACGWRRSPPLNTFGELASLVWENPCGHADSWEQCLLEASVQCARPGCVLLASMGQDPFCSRECACATPGSGCDCGRRSLSR